MASLQAQERLCSAYDAHHRASFVHSREQSASSANNLISAINRLQDAAIAYGMPIDEPDLHGWAARMICEILTRSAA